MASEPESCLPFVKTNACCHLVAGFWKWIFSVKRPREEILYISAKAVCDLVSWHTCSMLWGRVVLVWLCVCVCVCVCVCMCVCRKRGQEDIPQPSTPSRKWGGLRSPPCTPLLLLQSHVRTHNTLPSLFSHLPCPFFPTSLPTSDFCLLLSHTCLSSLLSPVLPTLQVVAATPRQTLASGWPTPRTMSVTAGRYPSHPRPVSSLTSSCPLKTNHQAMYPLHWGRSGPSAMTTAGGAGPTPQTRRMKARSQGTVWISTAVNTMIWLRVLKMYFQYNVTTWFWSGHTEVLGLLCLLYPLSLSVFVLPLCCLRLVDGGVHWRCV